MRTDLPIIEPHVSLREALHSMQEADVDLLPVVRDGAFIGVVTTTEILELDEILNRSPREQ
jgi:CBS domain-containing protein